MHKQSQTWSGVQYPLKQLQFLNLTLYITKEEHPMEEQFITKITQPVQER